eukprot:Sspe_Gene.7962::Locus_2699_Transcript_1_2_Confidence_0.667_Length_2269::g.7962::m.7962
MADLYRMQEKDSVLRRMKEEGKFNAKPAGKSRKAVMQHKMLHEEPGLKELSRRMKKMEWKGKGHELATLRKALWTYRGWVSALFPTASFQQFTKDLRQLPAQRLHEGIECVQSAEEDERRVAEAAPPLAHAETAAEEGQQTVEPSLNLVLGTQSQTQLPQAQTQASQGGPSPSGMAASLSLRIHDTASCTQEQSGEPSATLVGASQKGSGPSPSAPATAIEESGYDIPDEGDMVDPLDEEEWAMACDEEGN